MSKDKRDKVDNYAKYVREMYMPAVSLKKQLELEHVKQTLHHPNLRKSIEESNLDDDGNPKPKANAEPGKYERPWRAAMSKGTRSVDHGMDELEKQRLGSEGPVSPKPYNDIKKSSKLSSLTPMTLDRINKNREFSTNKQ